MLLHYYTVMLNFLTLYYNVKYYKILKTLYYNKLILKCHYINILQYWSIISFKYGNVTILLYYNITVIIANLI